MASFDYPPLDPDPDPAPLSPTIPLNPPMVGEASPFDHVDGQNRDLILESIRAWVRGPLRAWTTAWQSYLVYWLAAVEAWLNGFIAAADEYITEHAIAGYSWRTTTDELPESGTADVEITPIDELHPLRVGDLVSDESDFLRYGIITVIIDATHATVETLGVLRGPVGNGWWVTATPISATGTTDVVLPLEAGRLPQVNDLVSDESSALRYGIVTVIIDDTHVTVAPLGVLRGLAGFGWWVTGTEIAHTGTTDVVLGAGPDRPPQVHDLVIDESASSAYGEVTVVTDDTHVTVAFINTLVGPPGIAEAGAFDFTTGSLSVGGVYQGQMLPQPNMVGAFVLTTDNPAWVRVYASEAYMLADAARAINTPLNIADDHGCYLDFVSTLAELTKTLTPGIMFTDIGDGLWLSITNTDPVNPATIHITFDYRIFLG